MDVRGTKSRGELEKEEAERLIHRAPKVKPPRHDRRRERMDVDQDPDIDADPDLKDRDLSKNFKTIGGALIHRVALRYRYADEGKVRVRHRDSGRVVEIAQETLRENPGAYEKVEVGDDAEVGAKHGEALRALAKNDERLQGMLKQVVDTKSDLGGLAKENPRIPASAVFKGVQLPEGIKTLGELVRALQAVPEAKPEKKRKSVRPADAPRPPEAKPAEPAPEKAPEPAPPSTEEAPTSEKVEPKGEGPEKAPEEEKKPDAPEKKDGVGPPSRPPASDQDRMRAANLIMDTFPQDVATRLLAANMHPQDVHHLVDTYRTSASVRIKDPGTFAGEVKSFYETDPAKVAPPTRGKNAEGKLVPFESLSPPEKAEVMQEHRNQVVALSLGYAQALETHLSRPNFWGTPTVPKEVTSALTQTMLKGSKATGDDTFASALTGSAASAKPMSDQSVRKLLSELTPDAMKVAAGYLEAIDYHKARKKFLASGEAGVSERSSPEDIVRVLKEARGFFNDRAALYGEEVHRGGEVFHTRLLNRLEALNPSTFKKVQGLVAQVEKADYDRAKAAWKRDLKAWEQRKEEAASKQSFRALGFNEEPPKEPVKPPLYHLAQDPKEARREDAATRKALLDRVKTANSTYLGMDAMGAPPRTAVYHGIDPVPAYPPAYPNWGPAQQRDMGEADSKAILAMAQDWLKSPGLTNGVSGVSRDAILRAGLDLAIRNSKYDGQVPAPLYNSLLARLAHKNSDETLLTIRNASFIEKDTMKPSHTLRKLATQVAETQPKVAFDMVALADAMDAQASVPAPVEVRPVAASATPAPATDARYTQLKTLVIRTAAADAAARETLRPVLEQIKSLG